MLYLPPDRDYKKDWGWMDDRLVKTLKLRIWLDKIATPQHITPSRCKVLKDNLKKIGYLGTGQTPRENRFIKMVWRSMNGGTNWDMAFNRAIYISEILNKGA